MHLRRWRGSRADVEKTNVMGTIVQFPGDAVSRREGSVAAHQGTATVLILPVIRIERYPDETSGGRGPEEGTAPGRRRRRRARS